MSVVAGNGTEPFEFALILPGLHILACAEVVAAGNAVVHYVQAGVAEHDNVFCGDTEHRREELLRLGNAVKSAVVEYIIGDKSRVLCGKAVEHRL